MLPFVIVILLFMGMLVSVNLHEFEYKKTFLRLRDSSVSAYGQVIDSLFEKDIVYVLNSMEAAMERQALLMDSEGNDLTTSPPPSAHLLLSPSISHR